MRIGTFHVIVKDLGVIVWRFHGKLGIKQNYWYLKRLRKHPSQLEKL
jgi:hypothetical protein